MIGAVDWWLPWLDHHFCCTSYLYLSRRAFPYPRITFWAAATASCVTILDLFHSPLYALDLGECREPGLCVDGDLGHRAAFVCGASVTRRSCCGSPKTSSSRCTNALPRLLPSIKNSKSCRASGV